MNPMARPQDTASRNQVTTVAVALGSRAMRFLLALLAVIGLLASPVSATAAQATCQGHGDAMMSMPMADMPGMDHADGAADPCCDPAQDAPPSKHDGMSCLLACIAMCGVTAALPSTPPISLLRADHFAPAPGRMASLTPHDPGRLERPPRPIT